MKLNSKQILIIGAGPAGTAAAIFLRQKGFSVNVIERKGKQTTLKVGESLPPNAHRLLKNLGVWEQFVAAGHCKCFGNKSIWGTAKVAYRDFILQTPAYGWHIDRLVFEEMLQAKATQMGATISTKTTILDAQYTESGWQVKLKNTATGTTENKIYDFLIDASGRNSWLARRQGIERLSEEQQLALVVYLKMETALSDASSLIEATHEGWWYSAKLPDNRVVSNLYCSPNKEQREQWLQPTIWWELVAKSKQTATRLTANNSKLIEPPRFVAANSSILKKCYGKAWIAIGDAAMTYDPIASHGITMAMVSARDTADAIEAYFKDSAVLLEEYNERLHSSFKEYSKQRQSFYKAERRFPTSSYWTEMQTR